MAENYEIRNVKYNGSFVDWQKCPQDKLPQYAFVGRSNVGKSSLINMLTERKKLAHTSKSPGKTQTINFFTINEEWHLVDLPGYGYAKVAQSQRGKWRKMVFDYLQKSPALVSAFVLVDSRIPPQKIDIDFMLELGKKEVPFGIIYTKTDKLKLHKLNKNIKTIQDEILKHWEYMPEEFISSSVTAEGREEIIHYIDQLNRGL